MWKLVIEDDEGKRTVVPLTRDVYTVGRKEGNTIRLTERNVSREHARIRKLNGAAPPPTPPPVALPYTLEDLQSYNGVFVNGLRVAGVHELSHGDLIQIGDYRMILQDEAVAEEAPPPVPTTEDHKSTLPTGAMQRGSLLLERPNRMVMLAGPTPGMEYPMERERITIGRAEDCSISINHNSVSRLHCEVHSLGEGRFEIVDKASSNGVRVNGRELKRGIIEAGDIIELGDVRFRFVGAGQVFLPGVNDSQQLMAIGDRVAEGAMRPRTGGIAGFIAAGAVVAMVLVLGVWFFLHRQQTQQASPDVPQNKEALVLSNAKKQCQEKNECEGAHEMLMANISDGSPLRLTPDFKYIETRWADALLERAQGENNEAKKRSMLSLVAAATTVDDDRRRIAQTRLNELNAVATNITPSNTVPSVVPTNTAPTVVVPTNTAPTNTVQPHPSATVTHTATATTTAPTVKPPVKSPLDRASDMYKAGDLGGARQVLEPRVFGHTASPEEVKLLKGICKEQSDRVCRDKITQMYP